MDTTTDTAPTPSEDPRPTGGRHKATDTDASTPENTAGTRPAKADGENHTEIADEWGEESFPASDPPQSWAGADTIPTNRPKAEPKVTAAGSTSGEATGAGGNTPRAELHPSENQDSGDEHASDDQDGQLSESASLPAEHPSDIAEAAPNEAESMPDGHPGEVPS